MVIHTRNNAAARTPSNALYVPSRTIEKEYIAQLKQEKRSGHVYLAGVDEVGRGSLAGPVAVGIAVIDERTSDSFPATLRDSKQLTPAGREALIEPCSQWVRAWSVGKASPREIDEYGIIAALRIASARAVCEIERSGITIDAVLLDGSHNWWTPAGLFELDAAGGVIGAIGQEIPQPPDLPVRTIVKGDAQCAVIAAASVLAKVMRDTDMVQLAEKYPQYSWENNKGYSSPSHIAALKKYGPTEMHRRSWHLPGVK